jgi:hypothetical protein
MFDLWTSFFKPLLFLLSFTMLGSDNVIMLKYIILKENLHEICIIFVSIPVKKKSLHAQVGFITDKTNVEYMYLIMIKGARYFN